MKVAIITTVSDSCGIAQYTKALIKSLKKIVDVTVFPIEMTGTPKSRLDEIITAINQGNYTLVHIQHEYSFFSGLRNPFKNGYNYLISKLNKPTITTIHTIYKDKLNSKLAYTDISRPKKILAHIYNLSPIGKFVYAKMFNKNKAIILTTEKNKPLLIQEGIPAEKIYPLPPGVPEVTLDQNTKQAKAQLGLQNKFVLTIFGFINDSKGYELVLDALKVLPEDILLLIAGDIQNDLWSEYKNNLLSLIKKNALEQRVKITGFIPDNKLPKYMAATDLLLSPQTYANSSYSVMVAIAYEKPIIASNLECFLELNKRQKTLEIFDLAKKDDISRKLKSLIHNKNALSELKKQSINYKKTFDWDFVAQETKKVYTSIISNEDSKLY